MTASLVLVLFIIFLIGVGGGSASSEKNNSLANTTLSIPAFSVESLPQTQVTPHLEGTNITETLGKDIAEVLIAQNPDGPTLGEESSAITARDPQELVNQLFESQLKEIKPEEFRTPFPASALRTVSSDTAEAKEFASRARTILHPFITLTISGDRLSPNIFVPFVQITDATLAELVTLPTPAPLATLFAKEIELIQTHRNIFSAIASTETDPFRAFVALQIWQSVKLEFETTHRELERAIVQ